MTRRKKIFTFLLLAGLLILISHNSNSLQTNTDSKPADINNSPLEKFTEFSVSVNNLSRPYLLYTPSTYDQHSPAPLVLFLHGGLGDMNHAKIYNIQENAEKGGFLLALPNGASPLPGGKLATWNAGSCCDYARDKNSDDVSYLKNVIEDIKTNRNVDTKRIYAAGMSNGGMMSYRLACEASYLFAAIASVAGTDSTETCSPSEPVSILHIHAKDDTHVLFNGGAGEAYRDKSKVTDFASVPASINHWVSLYGLNQEAERTLSVRGAYCDTYQKPNSAVEITLCVTEAGGHSWPGSTVALMQPSQAINANDVIWEFFRKHSK